MWKPNNNIEKLYNNILKPNKDKEIYIIGESFSKKQGWIEGVLETCFDILKLLPLEGYKIYSTKSTVNNK